MKNIAADTPVRQIFDVYQGAVLPILLKDKTTGKNILWATDEYDVISPKSEIEFKDITGGSLMLVRPRIAKTFDAQRDRTKKRAEVFTPSWICNQMNNALDDDYLGYTGAFNTEGDKAWTRNRKKIQFNDGKNWQEYVDQTRLEITCGEAPFVTSRYNPTDGNFIEVKDRIGFLDRKLRVVEENADGDEYKKWSMRSLESCYGYEYQGDNLLIARINVFLSWTEHWEKKLGEKPDRTTARSAANVIAWNFWQMDGLTGRTPQIKEKECGQMTFLGFETEGETSEASTEICRIYDWRRKHKCVFQSPPEFQLFQNKGECIMKKFFAVIGNPPYQEEQTNQIDPGKKNFAPPIYHTYLSEAYKLSDKVEMIHPARFLFNAGATPKQWNEKMLADEHLSVLFYEENSEKVFPSLSTPIKGGIVVTMHDMTKKYRAIEVFTPYTELNSILDKVKNFKSYKSLSNIVYSRSTYRLTPELHADFPKAADMLSKGHLYDMSSNIFKCLPQVLFGKSPIDGKDYVCILGIDDNRTYKYINRRYVKQVENLDKYKVFVAQAYGSGSLGETMSELVIEKPGVGATESFISIGAFNTKKEALNTANYIKTKFVRILIGVLKVTPMANKPVWKYVPLQDFTSKSDIDWTKPVHEIDLQLYKKYGLSKEEKDFIETHVKEMV